MRLFVLVLLSVCCWQGPGQPGPTIGYLREDETSPGDDHGQIRWKSEAKPDRPQFWVYLASVENYSPQLKCRVAWPAFGFSSWIPAGKTLKPISPSPLLSSPKDKDGKIIYNGGTAPGEAQKSAPAWVPETLVASDAHPAGLVPLPGTEFPPLESKVELYVEYRGELIPVNVTASSRVNKVEAVGEDADLQPRETAASAPPLFEVVNIVSVEVGDADHPLKLAEFLEAFDIVWYSAWAPALAESETLKRSKWRGPEVQPARFNRQESRSALAFPEGQNKLEFRINVATVHLRQATMTIENDGGPQASILLPAYTDVDSLRLVDPSFPGRADER